MERRKILLGSGAVLATVLAGCSSSETDEETGDDSSFGDDDDDGYEGDDDDGDDGEVPGFDGDVETDSDKVAVTDVTHDSGTVSVDVETDTTDTDELYKELEVVGHDLAYAVTDPDRFKRDVEIIELYIEHDGAHVLGLIVDVQWLLDYLEDEISRKELKDKIVDSKR
ncbi:hypothetical protein [Natrialba swarupiae]|uniref:Uncharacterized protein n=1 Tax=Natrialba swarupiae TaxID=2448032 RepID=A0A5D5AP12_9EURY|nr:hypothetical protein [Natrialba swarupiae]MCW8172165.1 hypothetical protein [Natrialba swarupiae]TYT62784.1 hypothetical protein FYC77_07060 [Natrialba swarupiae]